MDIFKCLFKILIGNKKKYIYRVYKIKIVIVDFKWFLILKLLDFFYGNLKWYEM